MLTSTTSSTRRSGKKADTLTLESPNLDDFTLIASNNYGAQILFLAADRCFSNILIYSTFSAQFLY